MTAPAAKRPLTLSEMLRRSADMLESSNDRDAALIAVRHTLQEVEMAIDKRRPGFLLDQLLGNEEVTNA